MSYKKYTEIPFKDKGRSLDGLDCWGLIYQFYKHEKNITLPLLDSYETTEDTDCIQEIVEIERLGWRKVDKPIEGDIVLMRMKNKATHVGIYLEGDRVLHVHEGRNVCNEPLYGVRWKSRVEGFYRYE